MSLDIKVNNDAPQLLLMGQRLLGPLQDRGNAAKKGGRDADPPRHRVETPSSIYVPWRLRYVVNARKDTSETPRGIACRSGKGGLSQLLERWLYPILDQIVALPDQGHHGPFQRTGETQSAEMQNLGRWSFPAGILCCKPFLLVSLKNGRCMSRVSFG